MPILQSARMEAVERDTKLTSGYLVGYITEELKKKHPNWVVIAGWSERITEEAKAVKVCREVERLAGAIAHGAEVFAEMDDKARR